MPSHLSFSQHNALRYVTPETAATPETQFFKRSKDEYGPRFPTARTTSGNSAWWAILLGFIVLLAIGGGIAAIVLTAHHATTPTTVPTTAPIATPPTLPPGVAPLDTVVLPRAEDAVIGVQPLHESDASETFVEVDFLCNHNFANGTCRAVVTYVNRAPIPLNIDDELLNTIEQEHGSTAAPTHFKPGHRFGAATFLWDCGQNDAIDWNVHSGLPVAVSSTHIAATHVECPPLPI